MIKKQRNNMIVAITFIIVFLLNVLTLRKHRINEVKIKKAIVETILLNEQSYDLPEIIHNVNEELIDIKNISNISTNILLISKAGCYDCNIEILNQLREFSELKDNEVLIISSNYSSRELNILKRSFSVKFMLCKAEFGDVLEYEVRKHPLCFKINNNGEIIDKIVPDKNFPEITELFLITGNSSR